MKPQTLKRVIKRHLNLQAKWQNQKFKALVDSGATKNHISPVAIKKMGLPHRQKQNPYPLVTISGDPILYKDSIIYFKTGLIQLQVKGQKIVISFNVLLLGKDKTVLGMPFL